MAQDMGFNAATSEYVNMVKAGVIDPAKVTKQALQNAASLAGLMLTTETIVTEIPGTTLDVLREPVVLEGLLFTFQDTAGLRGSTDDVVESIGIDMANEAVRAADLVLFVIDTSEPADESFEKTFHRLDRENVLIVLNKIDLPASDATATLQESYPGVELARVSALNGEGVDELRHAIVSAVAGDELSRVARERVVLNRRLVDLLGRSRRARRRSAPRPDRPIFPAFSGTHSRSSALLRRRSE